MMIMHCDRCNSALVDDSNRPPNWAESDGHVYHVVVNGNVMGPEAQRDFCSTCLVFVLLLIVAKVSQ